MDTGWMNRLCSHVYPLCPNENKCNCFYWYVGNSYNVSSHCAEPSALGIWQELEFFYTKELTGGTVLTAGLCHRQIVRLSNSLQTWGVAVNLDRTLKNLSILGSLMVYVFCFFFQVAIKAWHVEEFLATAFELKLQVCGQYFYCLFCLNKWTVPSE